MLRLDPGEGRIHTTRSFTAWEGGGEYNVARGLRRCFGLRTAIVTALADNPVGRLVEDLMLQGGVDLSYLRWVKYDGVGRESAQRPELHRARLRTARGRRLLRSRPYGDRPAAAGRRRLGRSCSATPPAAVAASAGSTPAASSRRCRPTTPAVAREAMEAARRHGTRISYDLNYRDSLWRANGGKQRAREVNRALVPFVDVLFGNEEDFSAALGFDLEGIDPTLPEFKDLQTASFRKMIGTVVAAFPNIQIVATTLRTARSASVNGWGAIAYGDGEFHEVPQRDVEILDRVGGGDSFASGLIYGLLVGDKDLPWALRCGVAHGALAMSTPGDTTMATLGEVLRAHGRPERAHRPMTRRKRAKTPREDIDKSGLGAVDRKA